MYTHDDTISHHRDENMILDEKKGVGDDNMIQVDKGGTAVESFLFYPLCFGIYRTHIFRQHEIISKNKYQSTCLSMNKTCKNQSV